MQSWVLPNDLTEQFVLRINALPPSVKTDYLRKEFLSKFVSHQTAPPLVRRTRAINKWLATERENEATNDRLLTTNGKFNILPRVPFAVFVNWCRNLTRDILGDTPPLEALIGSFSGGASTSRSRTSSRPSLKYLGKAHVTSSALEWFELIEPEMPGWLGTGNDLQKEIVPGNVLFTVPKNTDIDRVACKEPDLNMFIQKGIGSYFRKSLRRIGINLNDQSINRSLAQVGSERGTLATLDLSSASDSVTHGLVAMFLPEIWFTLLDAVRCRVTIIDGEEHQNHMFSSMGNGFTFELESLLFYVLARATAHFTGIRGIVSVYGDDIICPTDLSQHLIWVLEYFGFQVNTDKSFTSGPIRESCGGHYYNGVEVTPFYLKKPLEHLVDLIDLANKLRRWASLGAFQGSPRLVSVIVDKEVEDLWYWLKGMVPSELWGGGDMSFKYQLVSDDTPSHRISEKIRRKDAGPGAYYQWLNATWDRTSLKDAVATSRLSLGTHKYELKKVRNTAVPRMLAYFQQELG